MLEAADYLSLYEQIEAPRTLGQAGNNPTDSTFLSPNKVGEAPKKLRIVQRRLPSPDDLIRSFNNWSFKREQPDGVAAMRDLAAVAIEAEEPVSFALYWGKGPRIRIAEPDVHCLSFLESLANRIKAVHQPGVSINLIFTDTHAALNGHAPGGCSAYFDAVREKATQFGFNGVMLSDLVASDSTVASEDVAPDLDTLTKLNACAAKWYRGGGDPEYGAMRYFNANMVERRAVEAAFPRSIFVTFNGSEYRELFPANLPIFYMYSIKRGTAIKPWFIGADDAITLPTIHRAGA